MTEYTHTEIANRIIEMGMAKNFIAIAIGMLNDRECDLNGQVARYANDMSAIMRKAKHELDEKKENEADGMTEELKPCPMCGNSAKIMTEDCKWTTAYYVQCTSSLCWLRTRGWGQKITAINNWNRRVKE